MQVRFWTLDQIKKIHRVEKEITEEVDPETGELYEEENWVYRDRKNGVVQPIDLYARGLMSRIFQHEIDHLDGKLFIDYVPDVKLQRLRKKIAKNKKNQLPIEGTTVRVV